MSVEVSSIKRKHYTINLHFVFQDIIRLFQNSRNYKIKLSEILLVYTD